MFDHKSAKEDIRNFGDWHWQLCQYLTAVDEGFGSELNQINDDPGKQLPMDSASAETRHRSTELYSLLASLVRNRAVSVARATPNSDGYEALRQFILNLKPTTQTRGLSEQARCSGDVRVLVEEVSDWENVELKCILLDSGAGAAVFPEEYATSGMASNARFAASRCSGQKDTGDGHEGH